MVSHVVVEDYNHHEGPFHVVEVDGGGFYREFAKFVWPYLRTGDSWIKTEVRFGSGARFYVG